MDYYNNASANLYSISSASTEFDTYPFPNQFPATEEARTNGYDAYADYWCAVEQPGPGMVSSPANFQAITSYDSVDSATSYATPAIGYGQSSYGYDWPVIDRHSHYPHPGFSSWAGSSAAVVASSTPTAAPTPNSVPFDYWGTNQSGPSTSTFYAENMHTSYESSAGPAGTALMSAGRFRPYETPYTRLNEYREAEAGPSTLAVPPVPYGGFSMPQPSGGISETTANADMNKIFTEEYRVPELKRRTRLPRGQGRPRHHRGRTQRDAHKFCNWMQQWMELKEAPSFNKALEIMVQMIPAIRPPVYQGPHLRKGYVKRTAEGSKNADDEFERRNVERGFLQELSRYYLLKEGDSEWVRPKLLLRVLEDLEDPDNLTALLAFRESYNRSSWAPTSTTAALKDLEDTQNFYFI